MKPKSSNKKQTSRKEGEHTNRRNGEKTAACQQAFSRLRNLGLLLSAISGAFLTSPAAVHPSLITIAALLATIGGLMVSVAKIMTDTNENTSDAGNMAAGSAHALRKKDVDKKPFPNAVLLKILAKFTLLLESNTL